MNLPNVHVPTFFGVIIVVVVLIVLYHLAFHKR